MTCVVDGCTAGIVRPKGMCGPHYSRYSIYGDPLAPRPDSKCVAWLKSAIAEPTDDCIIWPFGVSNRGYGKLKWQGRTVGAHCVALEMTVGAMPADKHVAAHSCRRTDCINPQHLRWATHAENHADKWRDGTMPTGETHPGAVLNVHTVRYIRAMHAGGMSARSISYMLGIDNGTTRDVISGRTWAWVDRQEAA